jgi:hypothetical protein
MKLLVGPYGSAEKKETGQKHNNGESYGIEA